MKLQANTTYKNSMASCCKNNWAICEPIYGCCVEFNLEVPIGYTGDQVIIRIIKPNGPTWSGQYLVEDGIVTIDVLDEMPDGFLNAYGGPYTLQYIDPDNNSVVWFEIEGESVQGVQFSIGLGYNNQICSLNIYEEL